MRSNTAKSKALIYTAEGAVAVFINPIEQLRRSVMSCLLFEGEFYEDGESIAKRIEDTVKEVLKQKGGAQTVADIAVEARSKMKLRHVPLLLATALIHAQTDATRAVVADTIARVIQRPDELGELVSIYWKEKKQPLSAQMKKGLAQAFQKFDSYALGKWNSDNAAIKLRDVLFLIHGKPKDEAQAEVWKKLADKALESPDTWEVALSGGADKKETFTRLLAEEKLGALALMRNLRNMQQAGVDIGAIREGLNKMKLERVLPFRFITAARYAPTLEPELEQAMLKCLADHEKLAGKTVLVVDNSGSMESPVSGKSELRRVDAACALAMLLREICEQCQIVVFGSTAGVIPPRRGFALRDAIVHSGHGGGTETANALAVAAREGYDRCVVFTDEQSHTTISGPAKGSIGYFINVASAQNGIGYRAWNHIDGFSENVIEYILQHEQSIHAA